MMPRDVADLVDALPLPTLVVGTDFKIVAANAAVQTLLGGHIVNQHYTSALRQPSVIKTIERVALTRTRATVSFQGMEGFLDTAYLVSVDVAGDAIVVSFQDRTEQQEVSQLRREFVANVSHELRTPLTALSGFIETLKGPARDDAKTRARFLDIMEREAGRMIGLVDNLLSLSRVEADERVRPSSQVQIGDLVKSALDDVKPVFEKAGATYDFLDTTAGAVLAADPAQLRQVILNLVENAVKYGTQKGPVTVQVSAAAAHPKLREPVIEIAVHNGGDPIQAHHLPRLTERFYRVDEHRNRAAGGTGLGLAIVKHIVNRHRGVLDIKSDHNEGTTVTVILPHRT